MMSSFRHMLFVVAVFAAALAATAHADIYQYTDENGVVNFTNAPGPSVKKPRRIRAEARTTSNGSRSSAPATAPQRWLNDSATIPASYQEYINSACEKYGVDPSLVHALVKVESDFNPFALSQKGAMGLMQLMPQTAADLNVKNSFSPQDNINGGVRYLRYLLDRYEGNLSLALAAYNAGETAVKRWGTVPPFKETKDYVKKIMSIYQGTGKSIEAPRYTIYVGHSADGTLLLTDNPSNHPGRELHKKMDRSL
jgi:soluble lytic murein transglycosylase-like protein